jgi:branched-chain amino acid aminotransferase
MDNLVWKFDEKSAVGKPILLKHLSGEREFDQISGDLPQGVYTNFRTYDRYKALHLEEHIQRLEHSAALMENDILIPREPLRQALRLIIRDFPCEGDLRIRLTVDLEDQRGMFYITVGHLQTPSLKDYQDGVKLVTWRMKRQMALAKRTNFIFQRQQVLALLPVDVYEALMISPEGLLLEGSTSNFFAIMNGELFSASEDILHGITRALVLRAAQMINLPVRLESLSEQVLPQVEEAFITSSSRAILPVKQIDEITPLHSIPGKKTRALMVAFEDLLQAEIEPI